MAEFDELLIGSMEQLRLLSFKFKMTDEDRMDLIQDTILKACLNKDKFEVGTNFMAWIYTIMSNGFIDIKRRRKVGFVEIDLITDNAACTETLFLDKGILIEFNKLPKNIKCAINLYNDGYKYHEISKIMNRPINTVKADILRGRRIMKKKYSI